MREGWVIWWKSEWIGVGNNTNMSECEWVSGSDGVTVWMSEWVNFVNKWMVRSGYSEWMSEWLGVSIVDEWVSECEWINVILVNNSERVSK